MQELPNENSVHPPVTDGDTVSYWMRDANMPPFPPLVRDTSVDICIVGSGIAGLTTAYLLARDGRSVVVVDDKPPGAGQTGRTTAHLSAVLDEGFHSLERLHGRDGARLAAESHLAAIARIEAICNEESIDCDFRRVDEYLLLGPGNTTEELRLELEAATRAGLHAELLPRAPLHDDTGPCLRFTGQAQFHPMLYLAGLARACARLGVQIHAATHATSIAGGDTAVVVTPHGSVTSTFVVVATNTPVNDRVAIHTKQAAYRTYAIATPIARGSIPVALYSDMADPYHYVRVDSGPEHDILIVGGADHRTGQHHRPETNWAHLEAWARARFSGMGNVVDRWSGQVMEPADGLAFIGRNPGDHDNVFIATGDSGHGITHGTIAGMLISDAVAGRDNHWTTLYDPARRTLRSVGELGREGVNVAAQYLAWMGRGDVASEGEIPRGEGAVVRQGLRMIATYVDDAGHRHRCSAACTHLGGVVRWNRAERTWDCPCHGARFDPFGRVVEGPAIRDLTRIDEPERDQEHLS